MAQEHIVESFDQELERLDHLLLEMGGLVESQFAGAIEALVRRNRDAAGRIRAGDKRVDAYEEKINELALRLLALRQPVAGDLRRIVAAIKIASDLERMGDLAKNIAKRSIPLCQVNALTGMNHSIQRMARLVQTMIARVLDAYTSRNLDMAGDVRAQDEEVDHLHTSLFRELLTYMMEDPHNISAATHLLFIAKNVERIGDHATNVAEQIHFMVEGHMPPDQRPKGDTASLTVITPEPAEGPTKGDGNLT